MNTFLYIAYHVIALFYLASGCILLTNPRIIEKLIPRWFPLLGSFRWPRIWNGINLIFVGIMLLIVGRWLVEGNLAGLSGALFLSAFEVYLSIAFYWKRNETFSAFYHFVINMTIISILFYMILNIIPMNRIMAALNQNLAAAYSVFSGNK